MELFDWLFFWEGRVVYLVGTISLNDLRNAIVGFKCALQRIQKDYNDLFYPGFQQFVENKFGENGTAKGWNTLITEYTGDEEKAMKLFYVFLREYVETLPQQN